jgi:hypothetical protein
LYERLGASALEHQIQPVVLTEYLKEAICIFSSSSRVAPWAILWVHREIKHIFIRAMSLRKGEMGLIDIDDMTHWHGQP